MQLKTNLKMSLMIVVFFSFLTILRLNSFNCLYIKNVELRSLFEILQLGYTVHDMNKYGIVMHTA